MSLRQDVVVVVCTVVLCALLCPWPSCLGQGIKTLSSHQLYSTNDYRRSQSYQLNNAAQLRSFNNSNKKIVCYYDSTAHHREGLAKFEVAYLESALQDCTHLIYQSAAINEETLKVMPLNEHFDVIKDNYRKVTELKNRFKDLKVLLSIGGNHDISGEGKEKNMKYRTVLGTATQRLTFVNSAQTLAKGFGFDGIDLAWEFPETKPKKIRSSIGAVWHSIKKTFSSSSVDEDADKHRENFVLLLQELKSALAPHHMLVSLTVLPNINSTIYYEPRRISEAVDLINVLAFDFYTPARNPKEADYPAPLYPQVDRRPDENVDAQIQYWLNGVMDKSKVTLGIATYGRAWRMDSDSDIKGMPPLHVDKEADPGTYTKTAGLLSHAEICSLLHGQQAKGSVVTVGSGLYLKHVPDSTHKKGTYAYRLPDENNNGGLWVAYENEDTVRDKVDYARHKGLGGIAIYDLTLEDFRGFCGHEKYALLRTVATLF